MRYPPTPLPRSFLELHSGWKWGPGASSRRLRVPVQLPGAVGEPQGGGAPARVAPPDQVGQKVHHAQVVLAAVTPRQQEVVPQDGAGPPPPPPSGGAHALQLGAEGVEQRLIGQRAQAALQVQQVGEAAADAGLGGGQPGEERAGVGRTLKRPLVQVQQPQVPTVAAQGVEDAGGGRRRRSGIQGRLEVGLIWGGGGFSPEVSPVDADQPPGEQVAQLQRRAETRHHGAPVGTGGGQEEAQSPHQAPDGTLLPTDDHQRPAAQQAEDGVLGEGVVPEEGQGPRRRLPPPPPPPPPVREQPAGLVGGGGVRGGGEAGAVRVRVQAQLSEGSPALRLGQGRAGVGR